VPDVPSPFAGLDALYSSFVFFPFPELGGKDASLIVREATFSAQGSFSVVKRRHPNSFLVFQDRG